MIHAAPWRAGHPQHTVGEPCVLRRKPARQQVVHRREVVAERAPCRSRRPAPRPRARRCRRRRARRPCQIVAEDQAVEAEPPRSIVCSQRERIPAGSVVDRRIDDVRRHDAVESRRARAASRTARWSAAISLERPLRRRAARRANRRRRDRDRGSACRRPPCRRRAARAHSAPPGAPPRSALRWNARSPITALCP